MRKKNIILLIDSISGGGAELVVTNLCRHIRRDDFNVSVCYFKEKGCRGEELEKESYDVLNLNDIGRGRNKYLQFLSLRHAVLSKSFDIIHSHSIGSLIEASMCRMFYPKVRLVHTFHFGNYPHYNKKYLLMEKLFCRIPNQLVAVGNEQKRAIREALNISEGRITTVWNGVEPSKESLDSTLVDVLPKGKKVIGSLSTCIPQKGLDNLLNVASILKKKRNDFIVLIVGDGPLRSDLEKKYAELDLSGTVFFLGWVTEATTRILPFFDIFVQTSLWEAMSMVILEAMAAGKPIVATEVGENKHVLIHGQSGFLSRPGDIKATAGYLEGLLNDADLRNSMGQNAKKVFERDFTVDLMARRYEQLYNEILDR